MTTHRIEYRKPFIDMKLYISDGYITQSIIDYIEQLTHKESDTHFKLIVKSNLDSITWFDDILNEILPLTDNLYTITTNADILFNPIPDSLLEPDRITVFKGMVTNGNTTIKLIHQIAFIYNSKIIVIGRSIWQHQYM